MGRYKRITLYFKMDDNQDSLRYALIGSLGKGKKTIFDNMIDQYLQSYGISNLEDLTLKDLQMIKKELMGTKEEKEKRGRGRPRKTPENPAPENNKAQTESKDILREVDEKENLPEQQTKVQDTEEVNKEEKEFDISKDINSIKTKNPMAINIDEDMDDGEETALDPALLGELGAFF